MGECCRSYPLRDRDHAASPVPLRSSDVVSARRFRRTQYYNDVLRPLGFRHELKLWLTAPLGYARCFELIRGPGRDFSERELGFLSLVRPYLCTIRTRWRPNSALLLLTERERDVLELLGLGLTNREIAQRLFISPMTVRTHLVNMFRKLGVGTRTAAVAAAHRQAFLAAPARRIQQMTYCAAQPWERGFSYLRCRAKRQAMRTRMVLALSATSGRGRHAMRLRMLVVLCAALALAVGVVAGTGSAAAASELRQLRLR